MQAGSQGWEGGAPPLPQPRAHTPESYNLRGHCKPVQLYVAADVHVGTLTHWVRTTGSKCLASGSRVAVHRSAASTGQ